MTPKELGYCVKGERIKQKIKDKEMWRMGIYVQAAVSVAVEHNLAGRKARSKYIEKPLLQEIEKKNVPMTEDEIQRQRELFIARMKAMQANFELNRKNETENLGVAGAGTATKHGVNTNYKNKNVWA